MANRQTIRPTVCAAVLLAFTLLPCADSSAVVRWRNNVDAAKVEATQSGKLVLLHFGTKTCGPCQRLEREVFTQPQLGDFLEQSYVPVKVDADLSPALANAYKISRVPSDVVITPQGNVVASLSCPMEASAYGTQLGNVAAHYAQTMSKPSAPVQAPMQSAYAGLQVGQYDTQRPVTTQGTPNANVQQTSGSTTNPFFNNTPPQAAAQPQQPAMQQQPMQPPVANVAQPPAAGNVSSPQGYNNPYAQPVQQAAPVTQQVSANLPVNNTAQQPVVQPAAAQPTVQQSQPQVPSSAGISLPPGSPPLAFEGFCPVTLKSQCKWVRGDSRFGALHRGRTFLFTSETEKQQFLANPDAYSPVFSGYDAVLMLEQNQSVEGSRKYGFEYRGAFYLFSSQATMDKFAQNPDRYSAQVRQAMNRLDGNLGTVIRR